ncbi:pyrroline-5-carboxylate reductase [Spirochaeta isovalerica]|uniref:Pyrroline-5-carboxylate reductase n=1 Tax=Spirochaeta isovalerica TaxID=150 RepID=A0A841RF69_9SPIO|nr:pyrroline-5-carboxylate reductase [Spirochaeta isovalerica]MBB6482031.1 pyrroline-5-carboxylate reductase [Spirochaeta isovalerica]
MNKKIGFIGTGNMGSAMIGGLISRGTVKAEAILVSDRNGDSLSGAETRWPGISCSTDNSSTVKGADIIILAVKPHIYKAVIEEIAPLVDESKIIVTIAAGVTISQAETMFGKDVKIVRTMPNTPALVGEGVTAYCCNSHVSESEEREIIPVLESFGIVEKIGEEYFHSVIAVSGSSPAYVFLFIEAMADAAVLQGLPRAQAYRMASQAVLGAAKMVRETGTHPGELKDAVCSPGGTTIEAVRTLEKGAFRSTVIEAMNNCALKSKEMTKG